MNSRHKAIAKGNLWNQVLRRSASYLFGVTVSAHSGHLITQSAMHKSVERKGERREEQIDWRLGVLREKESGCG